MLQALLWIVAGLGLLLAVAIPLLLLAGVVKWLFGGDDADIEQPEQAEEEAEPDSAQGPAEELIEPEFYTEDRQQPPPQVRMPEPQEKMVQAMRTPSRVHADFLRALLRDHGIWCFLSGDYNALGTLGLAEVTLHVPAGDLDRARQLIQEAEAEVRGLQASEGRLKCPACGYDLRATPDICPECGLRL